AVVTPRITSETVQSKYERILLEPLQKNRPEILIGSDLNASRSGIVALKTMESGARLAELIDAAKSFSGALQEPVIARSPRLFASQSEAAGATKQSLYQGARLAIPLSEVEETVRKILQEAEPTLAGAIHTILGVAELLEVMNFPFARQVRLFA